MTTEVHEVHIQALYKKIDELSSDCESHHEQGIAAIREVHRRIDEFTRIMIQMSEINKDVQALTSHQKALEAKQEALQLQLITVKNTTDANTEVSGWVKKGFGAVLLAVLISLLAIVGLK